VWTAFMLTQDRDLWWTREPSSESSGSITCREVGYLSIYDLKKGSAPWN